MNELYPIFLRTNRLRILIVGGGEVGLEKVSFLLKSSPQSLVAILSRKFIPKIREMKNTYSQLVLRQKEYEKNDLMGYQLIIAATDSKETNVQIYQDAKENNCLINVADTPDYCDFYMGSIVTKGDLKIGISTNGKSPTVAKRIRQFMEAALPDELNGLIQNLNLYKRKFDGDFSKKVRELNKITEQLIDE